MIRFHRLNNEVLGFSRDWVGFVRQAWNEKLVARSKRGSGQETVKILGYSESDYRQDGMHSQWFERGRYFGECEDVLAEGNGGHGQLVVC